MRTGRAVIAALLTVLIVVGSVSIAGAQRVNVGGTTGPFTTPPGFQPTTTPTTTIPPATRTLTTPPTVNLSGSGGSPGSPPNLEPAKTTSDSQCDGEAPQRSGADQLTSSVHCTRR